MRAAYIYPKSQAECNQIVSLLDAANFQIKYGPVKIGNKTTFWFSLKICYANVDSNFTEHGQITPNQLAKRLREL